MRPRPSDPLILGPDERAAIARVRAYAEAHPVRRAEVMRRRGLLDAGRPIGPVDGAICRLGRDFACAFEVEERRLPGGGWGWFRRLTVTGAEGLDYGHVAPLLPLFGIDDGHPEAAAATVGELASGEPISIGVLCPMEAEACPS